MTAHKALDRVVDESLSMLTEAGFTNPIESMVCLLAYSIYKKLHSTPELTAGSFFCTCQAEIDVENDAVRRSMEALSSSIPEDADVFLLGHIYESLLVLRKENGSYYTPKYIADFIVDRTLQPLTANKSIDDLRELRIIDPAMGAGVFVLIAMEYMSGVFQKCGSEDALADACGCIYGIDIDPVAVTLARLSVWICSRCRMDYARIIHNIQCKDSLLDDWGGRFDAIVGNPPYLFGENVPEVVRNNKEKFRFAKGQFDVYWLFYELAIDKYLREGGYHGYIIPDAVFTRDETACIRERISRDFNLTNLVQAGTVFGKTGVSGAIVIWSKETVCKDIPAIETGKFVNSEYVRLDYIDQQLILGIPGYRWLVGVDEQTLRMVGKLVAHSIPLGSLAAISRGEELGKRQLQAEIFTGAVPVLAGDDIVKLGHSFPSRYASSKIVRKKPRNYISPKIVIVKTGKNITASVDLENTVTLQSVYNITAVECDIWFLCGYLCSEIINNISIALFTGHKQLFPQLNQSTVASIPVYLPQESDTEGQRTVQQIADLARQAHKASPEDRSKLQQQIDNLVKKYLSHILQ